MNVNEFLENETIAAGYELFVEQTAIEIKDDIKLGQGHEFNGAKYNFSSFIEWLYSNNTYVDEIDFEVGIKILMMSKAGSSMLMSAESFIEKVDELLLGYATELAEEKLSYLKNQEQDYDC